MLNPRIKRAEGLSFGAGVVIASALTWFAYYTNSHPQVGKNYDLIYLVFFPASLGYMALENASRAQWFAGILIAISANGFWYWVLLFLLRVLFSARGARS